MRECQAYSMARRGLFKVDSSARTFFIRRLAADLCSAVAGTRGVCWSWQYICVCFERMAHNLKGYVGLLTNSFRRWTVPHMGNIYIYGRQPYFRPDRFRMECFSQLNCRILNKRLSNAASTTGHRQLTQCVSQQNSRPVPNSCST